MSAARRASQVLAVALLVALAALFVAQPGLAASGDHASALDFNLTSANAHPKGIAWNGTYFYVIDSSDRKAYAYNSSGTYTSSANWNLHSSNSLASGIAWDGTHFYVLNSGVGLAGKVYVYNADGTYNSRWDLTAANAHGRGIIHNGTYLYNVDASDRKAYAYTADGTYTSSADFDLDAANAAPYGITWYGDTYLYVLDRTDNKAYAYSGNGTYSSSGDWSLAAANTDAEGITGAASYLYVVDSADGKVYAYEGPNTDPAQTDATLSALALSSGTLSPSFSSSVESYTATVPYSVASVTVSATPNRSGASATGTGSHALNVGVNNLDVAVTAANGFSTRTYHIVVTRDGTLNAVTFDENGVLTTPSGTVVDSSLSNTDCFLFPENQPVVITVFNEEAKPVGVCWATSGTRYLYFLFPSGTPDFTANIASAISFTADLREGSASSYKLSETNGSLLGSSTATTMTVSGTPYDYARSAALDLVSGTAANLATGDPAHLRLEITGDRTVADFLSNADNDIPEEPMELLTSRNSAYDEATVSWVLVGPVVEYQIERDQAITVQAEETALTQYGNTTRFLVAGTIWGVDSYTDATVDPRYTYRYRVRARRGTKWGDWSESIISVGQAGVDLDAPANLAVTRAQDNTEVALRWAAPEGVFDSFAIQRQELVVVQGSTIFANAVTLADDIPRGTLTYTDTSISPGRTYEYRVAAVMGGMVGDYTEWARVAPFDTSLGHAPGNFRYVEDSTARLLPDRREYWIAWDEVPGADEYEVQIRVYDATGGRTTETRLVSAPTYFRTAYGLTELRVRGRRSDALLCGSGAGDYCESEWTGWYQVQFSPTVVREAGPTPEPDASIDEFQDDVDRLLDSTLDQSGVDVDPSVAVQFAVLVGASVLALASVVAGWKRGMKPLGVGMAFSSFVISLYVAHRLLGIPAAWPIGAQAIVAIPGVVAFARQLGAFR